MDGTGGNRGRGEEAAAPETAAAPEESVHGESLDRPLPEGVRHRVVALAAEAFGGLTPAELPAVLRPYARFTPSRRAKFAATALATALEGDPSFRQRVGARLREAEPELCEALDAGDPAPRGRPAGRGGRRVSAASRGLGQAGGRCGRGGPAGQRRAGGRGGAARAAAAEGGTGRGPDPFP